MAPGSAVRRSTLYALRWLWRLLAALLLAERLLKHLAVLRFFQRAPAKATRAPGLVSIIQPILSGDPALAACLERNLDARSGYRREFIWLIDADDAPARRICAELVARWPGLAIRVVELPPPAPEHNPKLVKLIAGAAAAQGEVLCVLDDDTAIPDDGLEACLPYLDQPGVGLAFGLPYYTSFDNLWSSLVACFVNSSSLMTYIPFAALRDPVTINGMCYALRRETLDAVGGFAGLERVVADDFAVAARLRAHGYRLAQTPLRHPIHTTVRGPRHYAGRIQRWLIFPRESLMRHLAPGELAIFYALVAAPIFFPWLTVAAPLLRPGPAARRFALAYLALSYAIFAHHNHAYLGSAVPWTHQWLVPLTQLTLPAQLLVALAAPRRIVWRGHVMQIERGGNLRLLRRRAS
ncbi:MAG: glycosyltransferase [Chloroflexales bacterium]|nr:glycosyltransferase [Chloroflexales bacterium]